MKIRLNTHFNFTKKEFNGLLTLVVLIVLVTAFPYVYDFIRPEPEQINEAEGLAILKLSQAGDEMTDDISYPPSARKSIRGVKGKPRLSAFDPNTIGLEDWQRFGLSVKQARAVLKYRAKGGKFRKAADLQKMYTISKQMYQQIAPYVQIVPENEQHNYKLIPNPGYNLVKPKFKPIEINGADTTELDKIKGIGPVFANRIVKYRARIGGFYKKEQLMEVFGLDSIKYNEIKGQIRIDAAKLKRININTAQFEDFKGHPYIRYKQVNALIQYRKQHGNYSNIADLNQVAIITPETVMRLAPYLEF